MIYLPQAPKRGRYSVPYQHVWKPGFLGADTSESVPAVATVSWSALWKLVFVGVATAVIADVMKRGFYGK